MRKTLLALSLLASVGCSTSGVRSAPPAVTTATVAAQPVACAPPAGRDTPANWCRLPADVRTFIDDRDGCDHFRGEPWPASDSDADRARRREILDGLRTSCAGTDARLAELKRVYAANADVQAALAGFEARVER